MLARARSGLKVLKRVAAAELRLGMYVDSFDAPWLDHPFWRTRFLLVKADDLERIRSSGVGTCWIDTDKGIDVDLPPPPPARPLPPETPRSEVTHSVEAELEPAAALIVRAREAVASIFQAARLGQVIEAEGCRPLVDEIAGSVKRNPDAFVNLARLKRRDDVTYMHSVAVCALMVALGRELGFDDDGCREAGLAGLLHDVGKALMPLEVLNKPGALTEAEFGLMRTHPERGWELLKSGDGVEETALDVCLYHHERMDGKGYPHRLSADRISPLARMGAVCDVYDAVTSDRPYRDGWDPADALGRMASWTGQFDDAVFAALVRTLGIYPIGSLVRLKSGKLAVVVEHNAGKPLVPTVKAFYSTRSNMPIAIMRIDLSRPGCSDAIEGREPLERWNFPYLNTLWAGSAAPRGR